MYKTYYYGKGKGTMSDKTYKNFFDDGYTTYHDDGSKSVTYKNFLDDGTTTYHQDGSKSQTYKNFMDDGYTTYHDDGTKSVTYRNFLDDGTTTYHQDGSKSRTYKNFLDDGYTTYHEQGLFSTYDQSLDSGYSSGFSYSGYSLGGSYLADCAGIKEIFGSVFYSLLAGGAVWWFSTKLPVIMLSGLALVIILGLIQRNKHRSYKRQSVWYMWSMILATLLGFYMVQHRAATPDDALLMLAFWIMPLAYTITMFLACRISSDGSSELTAAFWLGTLIMVSWFATVYRRYSGNYKMLYYIFEDVLLIIVLVVAIITLKSALERCRDSSFVFVIVCAFIYLMAKELTGFRGVKAIVGLIVYYVPQLFHLVH